ncbi:hypothetical protein [Escherichia coli]|uniref:hypothetical protein n=1 Tax=Escherichia coli TaxID=562 RepID=UPI0038B3DF81
MQDGKWLFRNGEAASQGAGIMLFRSDDMPVYSQTEIKNGDTIPLDGVGVMPSDQTMNFYAGVSCGGSSGCAEINPVALSATILFDFIYR